MRRAHMLDIELLLPQSYIRNRSPNAISYTLVSKQAKPKSYTRNREPKCDKLYTGHETNLTKELYT